MCEHEKRMKAGLNFFFEGGGGDHTYNEVILNRIPLITGLQLYYIWHET